jgi:hypothetical protein
MESGPLLTKEDWVAEVRPHRQPDYREKRGK